MNETDITKTLIELTEYINAGVDPEIETLPDNPQMNAIADFYRAAYQRGRDSRKGDMALAIAALDSTVTLLQNAVETLRQ